MAGANREDAMNKGSGEGKRGETLDIKIRRVRTRITASIQTGSTAGTTNCTRSDPTEVSHGTVPLCHYVMTLNRCG
jgi:hypothetical protein